MFAVSMLALSEPNGLGRTPPMGFNPYNHMKASGFAFWPNETTIRATAMALKSSGLQALGYTYVNLDAGWSLPARDAQGRPQPNASRYPNLASGKLASWLHSEGFKFGIYSSTATRARCTAVAAGRAASATRRLTRRRTRRGASIS